MVELSGDRYLLSSSALSLERKYLEILDATGHIQSDLSDNFLNPTILDYVVADDGNIVILRKEDGIRLTKVSGTDLNSVIWDDKFTETAGTLDPKKLFKCSGGGFFVSGTYTNAGQTDLYVLKVDKNGEWQ